MTQTKHTPCPDCDGKGQRTIYDIHFMYGDNRPRECPDCNGTGAA